MNQRPSWIPSVTTDKDGKYKAENMPQSYKPDFSHSVESCTFPNCTGVKVPDGGGWKCTCGGRYHYFWVKAQKIRDLQKKFYALPIEQFKNPAFRYFEYLRRNVKRDGIKEVPQQVLL